MPSEEDILGNNSFEDVAWVCSLSEPELVRSLFPPLISGFQIPRCESRVFCRGFADEFDDAGASTSERDRPGASRREV
ncbi:uncharacterized protein J3R85_005986 [Psidium guajava]|nr:uncharacterized protein J3R85_005986 [Psidium guajava]